MVEQLKYAAGIDLDVTPWLCMCGCEPDYFFRVTHEGDDWTTITKCCENCFDNVMSHWKAQGLMLSEVTRGPNEYLSWKTNPPQYYTDWLKSQP